MTNPIQEARERRDSFRAIFDAQTQERWRLESAELEMSLWRAVWDAFDAGMSVAEIGRWYGTKDRKTIYDIIRKRADLGIVPRGNDVSEIHITVDEPSRNNGYAQSVRVLVQGWVRFESARAQEILTSQYRGKYTGYATVYPVKSDSNAPATYRFVAGAVEHLGGPLQAEIIDRPAKSRVISALDAWFVNNKEEEIA